MLDFHHMRPNTRTPDTVFQRTVTDPESGCWVWQRGKDRDGYGWIHFAHKQTYAHRFSYEVFVGQIPDGMKLDHLLSQPELREPRTTLSRFPTAQTSCAELALPR